MRSNSEPGVEALRVSVMKQMSSLSASEEKSWPSNLQLKWQQSRKCWFMRQFFLALGLWTVLVESQESSTLLVLV